MFHAHCIVCHSQKRGDSAPFGPPNLYTAFSGPSRLTAQQAETIITHGKGNMPSFATVLSKTEIRNVVAYLRTR